MTNEEEYDRQLIELLRLLKETDLTQFAADLKINDYETFEILTSALLREKERVYARRR